MDRPLCALVLFLHFVVVLRSGAASAYSPDTTYYLSCGASRSTSVALENPPRSFVPDGRYLSSSSNSRALSNLSSTAPELYANARIFTAPATYRFPVNSSGTHVLRLHFYPFSADGFNLSAARFSVYVLRGRFVLLDGFPDAVPIKEYFLWVDSDSGLDVTFHPSSNSSFAFVNALELFTAPAELINNTWRTDINTLTDVLETVHRINVGGPEITSANDTLWRTWIPDDKYLLLPRVSTTDSTNSPPLYRSDKGLTEEIAPRSVYRTARVMSAMRNGNRSNFNVTWIFPVTSGYKYALRLHFCDIVSQTYGNTIYFSLYIDSGTEITATIRSRDQTDMLLEPFYMPYVVGSSGTSYINISIGTSPKTLPRDQNAYLNGVEIFRTNNSVGSLGGSSNIFFDGGSSSSKSVSVGIVVGAAVGGLVVIALVIAGVFLLRKRRRTGPAPVKPKEETAAFWSPYRTPAANSVGRSSKSPGGSHGPSSSPRLNNSFGLQVPLLEVKAATNNFDEGHIIGSGGFGKVYRGVLGDGTKVAVKRGSMVSKQGYPEFENEIILPSKIRHKHLVSLIGYCDEQSERILVSEFMENGALKDYLYGSPDKPTLSWKQRLQICIGTARGLHYLHTGYSETIIHRDVKSTNILLDGDFSAKVADFGLSRVGPSAGQTHVSTNIKGTFGYLDPEYFKTGKLTDKSDVYSFGVMLFEVLCARPVVMPEAPREEINLAEWVLLWHKRGQIDKIIDERLAGNINLNSLRKFAETAERCLADYGVDRPTFGDILWNLEYALELQETEVKREPFEDSGNADWQTPTLDAMRVPSVVLPVGGDGDNSTTTTTTTTTVVSQQYGSTPSSVFSQLVGGEGR